MRKKPTKTASPEPVGPGGKENGGAVPYPDGEFSLYCALVRNVAEFLKKRYPRKRDDALDRFFESGLFQTLDGEEETGMLHAEISLIFNDWLMHTRGLVAEGFTGIELYLEKEKNLTVSERGMLVRMNDSVMSLFDVHVRQPRNEIVLDDLLLDYGRFTMPSERMKFNPGKSVMGARVIRFSHGRGLGTAFLPFIHEMKSDFLDTIRKVFKSYERSHPGATMEAFLRDENPVPEVFLEYTRLMREAGEEKSEKEAHDLTSFISAFDVFDRPVVEKCIRTLPCLSERENGVFEWFAGGGGKGEFLGTVVLSDDTLVLGTMTEEMRGAGKLMLRSACRDSIRHRIDTVRRDGPDGDEWHDE